MDITYYKKYEPIFGSWHIVREIGEGSFGKVFEIEREDFGYSYKCAMKAISIPQSRSELDMLLDDGMDKETVRDYYRAIIEDVCEEVHLASKLKGCPNIVSYEDYKIIERSDGIGWDILIRMELLTSSVKYFANNPPSRDSAIRLGIDICKALEACRRNNIIHCDIKLDNILVSNDGEFKLSDFRLAQKFEGRMRGMPKKGILFYMAPEIFKGEPYGPDIDIYSLGMVLYRLLNNNRTPFLPLDSVPNHADRDRAHVRRLRGEPFPAPAKADKYLSMIILKACAYKSEDRYASPTEMRKDLEAAASGGVPLYAQGCSAGTDPYSAQSGKANHVEKPERDPEECLAYYKKYEPIFGSWHIVRQIGMGTFGKVFEIERKSFLRSQTAALKVISIPHDQGIAAYVLEDIGDREGAVSYFRDCTDAMLKEIEKTARLPYHENIVRYSDYRAVQRREGFGWDVFLRMELLTPLHIYLKTNPPDVGMAIKLGIDICKALELCHSQSILHRNIKPGNIFISDDGRFMLGDLGITETMERVASGFPRKGTYDYTPPEVYHNEEHSVASDIYSLGMVMYRLLNNNRNPFMPTYFKPLLSDRDAAVSRRMRGDPLPEPINSKTNLSKIILKACDYNTRNRYSSAAEMRAALERCEEKYNQNYKIAEKLTDDIFESVKGALMNGIPPEYHEDITAGYREKMLALNSYLELEDDYNEELECLIELELSMLEDMSPSFRLSEYVPDKAMEDIRRISARGYEYAKAKLDQRVPGSADMKLSDTIESGAAEEALQMLEDLLPKVKWFNAELARHFVSEGGLDYAFASGKTDKMSFRIGDIYRFMKF